MDKKYIERLEKLKKRASTKEEKEVIQNRLNAVPDYKKAKKAKNDKTS